MSCKVAQQGAPGHSFKLPCVGLWQEAYTLLLAHGPMEDVCFPCEALYSNDAQRDIRRVKACWRMLCQSRNLLLTDFAQRFGRNVWNTILCHVEQDTHNL